MARSSALVASSRIRTGARRTSARNGKALLLPAGEAHAALRNGRIIPIRRAEDELLRLRSRRSLLNLRTLRTRAAPGDVVANALRKQLAFLQCDGNLPAQRLLIVLAHIHAIHEHSALRHVIKSGDEAHKRRFAAARRAHDGHRLPRLNHQADVLKHPPFASGVGKGDIPKLDAPAQELCARAA